MFDRYKSRPDCSESMTEAAGAGETLLKLPLFLRYDHPHARASAGDDEQRSAEGPAATGAGTAGLFRSARNQNGLSSSQDRHTNKPPVGADMEVTGPGSDGGSKAVRPSEHLPTEGGTSAAPGLEMPPDPSNNCESGRVLKGPDHPEVRAERLARIRAEIAAGRYETAEKLEIAVEQLLREIG